MPERTFEFEGITCTIKRLKIRDTEKRDRIEAVVKGQPYAFAFADFQTSTVKIDGTGIELLENTGDIGAVEAAFEQFRDLDEAFLIRWQEEKRLLLLPVVVQGEDKKKPR